jgi:hypothetical protein
MFRTARDEEPTSTTKLGVRRPSFLCRKWECTKRDKVDNTKWRSTVQSASYLKRYPDDETHLADEPGCEFQSQRRGLLMALIKQKRGRSQSGMLLQIAALK